jgi:hypothetical protein
MDPRNRLAASSEWLVFLPAKEVTNAEYKKFVRCRWALFMRKSIVNH